MKLIANRHLADTITFLKIYIYALTVRLQSVYSANWLAVSFHVVGSIESDFGR